MQVDLQVLDVHVRLSGPEEVVGPIAAAYRRFGVSADSGRGQSLAVECRDEDALWIGGRELPFVRGVDPVIQVYPRFLNALLDRTERHAMLHAGALVDPDGAAVLVAAPSGHGKTTLTLELLARGYRFLGDDYAPLDLSKRTVEPFPRAVGLVPDSDAPVPQVFRDAAAAPDVPHLFGKALVDVGRVLGDAALAAEPAPLGRIVLLADSLDEPAGGSALEVSALAADAPSLEATLAAVPGVEIAERRDAGALRSWVLNLRSRGAAIRKVSAMLDDDRILFSSKYWSRRPDFTGAPRSARLVRRKAAELLGRELLNRRSGGGLLRRYGGSVPRLFLDLAQALAGATCWRVVPGTLRATADLIERLD